MPPARSSIGVGRCAFRGLLLLWAGETRRRIRCAFKDQEQKGIVMTRMARLTALFALLLAPCAYAQTGAIRCGKLLDVRAGKLLSDQVVVFDKGGITAIGTAATTAVPRGVTPVNLSSATCLPGLIDVHTHITSDPTGTGYEGLGISVPRETVTGVKNARLALRAGFTAVRNVGATGFSDVAARPAHPGRGNTRPREVVSGPRLRVTPGARHNHP